MSQSENKPEILALIKEWKKQHQKIVFTNGVFDILHVGHVDYLEKAKSLGDKLVVAVNSDDSVRRLNKAPERPINPEFARVKIISALKCVDAAFIFNEDTPLEIIQEILPDVLVKGGDYDASETDRTSKKYIAGSAEVKANGGAVVTIDLVQGFSTTGIVERMRKG